jgi:hypothetical protein
VARYDITLDLPAVPGAWLEGIHADRLGAALQSLPSGAVRSARLASRTRRGFQVARVKVEMSVTAPEMAAATAAAVETLTTAADADAGSWDMAGLSAEIRSAPVRSATARGRAGTARPGRLPLSTVAAR